MAKSRVESNMIDGAEVIGSKGNYVVVFKGSAAEWNEKPVVLSSSRQPYEPRIFKSLDGAIAELNRIGLHEIAVKVTD